MARLKRTMGFLTPSSSPSEIGHWAARRAILRPDWMSEQAFAAAVLAGQQLLIPEPHTVRGADDLWRLRCSCVKGGGERRWILDHVERSPDS